MLIGQYSARLTEKDRLIIPAKFRNELGETIIIAKWYEGCLVVVPSESWEVLLNKLTGESKVLTAPVRETDRFVLGSAYEVKLDSQGRFVVPKVLKEYAKLKEETSFIGLGNRVEIWDLKVWNDRQDSIHKKASDFLEKLSNQH